MTSKYDIDEQKEQPINGLNLHSIHPLNCNDFEQGSKYIVIGAPGKGKSRLIKDFMYFKKHIFPVGQIFSGSEDSNTFFSKFFPKSFIFTADDICKFLDKKEIALKKDNPVIRFRKRQKMSSKYLINNGVNPWCIQIFDDCTADSKFYKKDILQDLFKDGRHWKMSHISSFQFCLDLPSSIRGASNGIFLMKEGNPRMRERLYENYAENLDKYEFDYIMDYLTDDFCSMYINKRATSSKIDDTILYYKADINSIPDNWRFGCDEMWECDEQRIIREE
jgi:hypothetical protein